MVVALVAAAPTLVYPVLVSDTDEAGGDSGFISFFFQNSLILDNLVFVFPLFSVLDSLNFSFSEIQIVLLTIA